MCVPLPVYRKVKDVDELVEDTSDEYDDRGGHRKRRRSGNKRREQGLGEDQMHFKSWLLNYFMVHQTDPVAL